MKPILQVEAAECGLACLAMVATHHGHRCSLAELRKRFGLSLKGANLSRLAEIARALGLQPRPLRLELDDLDKLRLPCILHWDLNHFVVLTRLGRRGATVVDPGFGERQLRVSELSGHFTGVALELSPGHDFQPKPAPPAISLRQLTGRIRGLGAALAQVFGLSLALQVFVVLAPFYLQWVIDQVLVSADRPLLSLLALAFGGLLLLQVATGWVRGAAVLHLSSRLGQQWMGNVFAHLLRLPLEFFERRQLADVVSRLGSVQAIQRSLTTSAVEAVVDGLMALVTLVMMLFYSPRLALLTGVAVLAYLGLRFATYDRLRRGTERQLIASAQQQGHLLETLRGMQSLKVSGQEAPRQSGHANLLARTLNAELSLARLGLGLSGVNLAVFGLERLLVVWLGAGLVLDGEFSVGMLVAYLAYKDRTILDVYGVPVRLTGHADWLRGLDGWDIKTSGKPIPADRHAGSMQWRSYCLLFGLQRFTYRHVYLAEDRQGVIYARSIEDVAVYPYPRLRDDVVSCLGDLLAFAEIRGCLDAMRCAA